jgi:hypothetical protein
MPCVVPYRDWGMRHGKPWVRICQVAPMGRLPDTRLPVADASTVAWRSRMLCSRIAMAFRDASDEKPKLGGKVVPMEVLEAWKIELALLLRALRSEAHRHSFERRDLNSLRREQRYRAAQSLDSRGENVREATAAALQALAVIVPYILAVNGNSEQRQLLEGVADLVDELQTMKDLDHSVLTMQQMEVVATTVSAVGSGKAFISGSTPHNANTDLLGAVMALSVLVTVLIARWRKRSGEDR